MKKQKMTSVEFMNWQGYGTKGRMHDIERIEKLLKREKYKSRYKSFRYAYVRYK